MGQFYVIAIETDSTPEECIADFLHGQDYKILRKRPFEINVGTKYFGIAFQPVTEYTSVQKDYLDILKPTVRIVIYSLPVGAESRDMVYRTFVQWTDRCQDTAMLLGVQGQCVLLLSKDGNLYRNAQPRLWNEYLLNLITKEYTDKTF